MRTAVSILLIVALVGCLGADERAEEAELAPVASAATTLRVADWNLQVNGEGTDGVTDRERTYQMLRAKAADADIITCNECYASTITSFAARLTADSGVTWHAVTKFDVGEHNHSGVWSRYPFVSTPIVHHYSQPASMSTGPQTAGEVDVDVNGQVLHLVVTRLCSPCGGSVRAVQAHELVAWAQGFGEPRLVTGDFNDVPGASSTSAMAAGYIDTFRRAQAMNAAFAYPDNPSGRTHGCSVIDYIWLSAQATQMTLVDATVPDVRLPPLSNPNGAVHEKVGCSDDYGVRPSDHNMVKATFQLGGSVSSALPAGWTAADVGAVGKAGATSYAGGTFTIDAGGTFVYGTSDAFHYTYQPWTGDGVFVARVGSIAANGGTDAAGGVMVRESVTSASSRLAALLVFSSGKAKLRSRSTPGGDVASSGPTSASGPPRWVKLTRTQNHFEGFTSTDGTGWGSPIASADVAMPATLWVGLAGVREGNFGGATGRVTFDSVALSSPGLASPWRTRDIGSIDVAGAAASASGTYTIDAGGTWIWSTQDAFRFVYQPWRGDGTLVARIDSLAAGGGTDAAAGVMFRSTLDASSPLATLLAFASGKAKLRSRATPGADVTSTGPSAGTAAPRWVKLVRVGNHVDGYVSTDGASWGAPVGSATIAGEVYAGVAVVREGNAGGARARAVVSAVALHGQGVVE